MENVASANLQRTENYRGKINTLKYLSAAANQWRVALAKMSETKMSRVELLSMIQRYEHFKSEVRLIMYGKDRSFAHNTSFKAPSPEPILHPSIMYFSEE